ncbi:ATP-grasp domain-containing protein [Chryseobacterium fluminis]|uniref:ATP-grasp domain-containing protein n=1 Tax=Chryseobacterium fluminis TaxID=2983606 RepID=UPI002254946F|nr:ATP-grasp domain-containing protein [Chryseobacterium sp. MMS21-Ot14]UZT99175.1 ATP-grasp domain-containing protein [Chryseobacterium sp. MMS21-Ot14]
MKSNNRVAVLYQSQAPPPKNGITKPMKAGGYADSGADIAFSLRRHQTEIVTPSEAPSVNHDLDWVFPDTREGIQLAIEKGANVIWLNTVLYAGHPIENFTDMDISVVGQIPRNVDIYDDKLVTNQLLKKHHLPIPRSVMITADNATDFHLEFPYPVVAKPIRGRGSQGVTLVQSREQLAIILGEMLGSKDYGHAIYAEEFLSGEELTVTVMTPGKYSINKQWIDKTGYWSLPPVRRFNHQNGIAPYNGTVAVIHNSEVLTENQLEKTEIKQLLKECELAASLVNAKAPIRIDCRADCDGNYFLFDLNMKPNMTGASRPHRQDQDSLTAIAARKIGWSFDDLILNMLNQKWKL